MFWSRRRAPRARKTGLCVLRSTVVAKLAGLPSATAANSFLAIPIQYGVLACTLAASVWIIYKGLLIEPPASAIAALNRLTMEIARPVRRPAPLRIAVKRRAVFELRYRSS
jgi:hypothetical protein